MFKIPEVESSRIVFDKFVKIRSDILRYGAQHRHEYFTLIPKADAINILAVTPEGQLVLTEEYRHPTGKVLLGCPGGYMDPNESPLEAAKRELLEETGYTASDFQIMGRAYAYPGLSSQNIIYIVARRAHPVAAPQLETSEVIRTVPMSESELTLAIAAGAALDGILCTALFFFRNLGSIKKQAQ